MLNGVYSISFPGPSPGDSSQQRYAAPATFVAGPENRLVSVAVRAALEAPACGYHPLVFYGPPGSGKSHLARGIAAELQRQQPELPQLVVTGAEFAQEFARAQHARQLAPLRQRYRTLKLLVLEDLAPLAGKSAAQQELVQTLDALADQQGLAVVTSRESPQLVAGISAALRSRLSGGLEVPLALPGAKARLAILENVAATRGASVPKAVCRVLADGLKAGAAELIGALSALERAERLEGKPIDCLAARLYVASRQARCAVGVRGIAALTAKYFRLKVTDLKSPSRQRPIVMARGVAMLLCRQLTGQSFEQIGTFFGGRDHTTVLHGCRRTEELIKTDAQTRQAVDQLRAELIGV